MMLCLGVGSDIGLLRNPSTTQPAFAVIVSVIRGESEGNTTCKLKVKPLIIKCLSVGYIMIRVFSLVGCYMRLTLMLDLLLLQIR